MKKGTKLVALLLGLALVAPACSPANNPSKSSQDPGTSSEAPAFHEPAVQCPFSVQCCQVVKYALSKGIQTKINEDIVDFCNVKNQKEWEKIIHYLCSGGCASSLKAKFKFKGN